MIFLLDIAGYAYKCCRLSRSFEFCLLWDRPLDTTIPSFRFGSNDGLSYRLQEALVPLVNAVQVHVRYFLALDKYAEAWLN